MYWRGIDPASTRIKGYREREDIVRLMIKVIKITQLNPDGSLSNNNQYVSKHEGKIREIIQKKKYALVNIDKNGEIFSEKIPAGPELIVKEGDFVKIDQALTQNPNVGGFGQTETEIVLQSPARIIGLIGVLLTLVLGQLFFVYKKKQFERVQLASGLYD